MNLDKNSLLLYAVTDRAWLGENSLAAQVEEAIKAGVTLVQLREKDLPTEEFRAEAQQIKEITDRYNIPFIVNDNLEVALAVNADGIHVGQDDMEVAEVRKILGADKILGLSVQTVAQAIEGEKAGADYLGVGAMFSTSTKLDADTVDFHTLQAICASVKIPVVAIGGISQANLAELQGSGIQGVAVVSAIFAQENIYQATQDLVKLTKEVLAG